MKKNIKYKMEIPLIWIKKYMNNKNDHKSILMNLEGL